MGSCHSSSNSAVKSLKRKSSKLKQFAGKSPVQSTPKQQASQLDDNSTIVCKLNSFDYNDNNLPFIDLTLSNSYSTMSSLSSANSSISNDNSQASQISKQTEINNNQTKLNLNNKIPVLSTLNHNHTGKPSLTRLVYKPPAPPAQIVTSASSIITTASALSSSSAKCSTLIKSQSHSPPSSPTKQSKNENDKPETTAPTSTTTATAIAKTLSNTNNRRNLSPFRSFIKPPTALVNKTNQATNNKQKSLESQSSVPTFIKQNQSSSMSSLSSSSSSVSNPKQSSKQSPTQTKNSNSSLLPSPVKNKTSSVCAKPLQSQTNLPQPTVHKKRLFSPYKFNISTTNQQIAQEECKQNTNTKVETNLNKSTEFPSQQNTTNQSGQNSKLRFSYSKMPMPAKSNLKTINTNKFNNNNNPSGANSANSKKSESSLLKRDDSAYSSSTSSTSSSSNDVDLSAQFIKQTQEVDSSENCENFIEKHFVAYDESVNIPKKEEILEENNNNFTDQSNKMSVSIKQTTAAAATSIRDSVGELNHLMLLSSTSLSSNENQEALKARRPSSASLNNQTIAQNSASPMFKPPSNLPPIENGEIIQMDIESYRLLMSDLQNCKLLLHKLAYILKEPTSATEFQGDDNPLLSSFYQVRVYHAQKF